MAFDEDLAHRIRELVSTELGISERKMFGGLAFMIDGHMAVAASRQGGILLRVDPADMAGLLASGKAEEAIMGGRTMRGWVRVMPEHLRTKRELGSLVDRGVRYARTQPAKSKGR